MGLPEAAVGGCVTDGGVGKGRREGENQSPAAIQAVSQGKEAGAEAVGPGSALHMGAAYMQDADIPGAEVHQRIQFLPKSAKRCGLTLQMAFLHV